MALPRDFRLRITRENLHLVRKAGKTLHSQLLRAYYLPNVKDGEQNGFGVIIGASLAKKATVRNRLRRYIQEGIVHALSKPPSGMMVIYPKREIVHKDRETIIRDVEVLMKDI